MPAGPLPITTTFLGRDARGAANARSLPVRGLTAQSTENRCSMASMQFSHEMHLRTRSARPEATLFGRSASASIGRPIAMKSARPLTQYSPEVLKLPLLFVNPTAKSV